MNPTLGDLIDLKEIKRLSIKVNGKENLVVCLYIKLDKELYAMVAGGYLIPIDQETFDILDQNILQLFKNLFIWCTYFTILL